VPEKAKVDLKDDIGRLYEEKDVLEEQIKILDQEKIERLQNINAELEKKVEWLDKDRIKAIKERDHFKKQIINFRGKKWSNSLKMISALAFLDLILIPIIVLVLNIPVQWIFISIGVITFFGILLIANYMSGTSPFDTGEVRKALTGSFIIMYFALVPLLSFGSIIIPADEPIKTIITNFTWIVGAIVIFYFGSRTVEEYVRSKY
jgi:hypothetical protein